MDFKDDGRWDSTYKPSRASTLTARPVSQFLPTVSSHFKDGVGFESNGSDLSHAQLLESPQAPAGSNFQAQQTDERTGGCRRSGMGQAGGSNATGDLGTAAFVLGDREAKEAEDSG
jgi:hypothetical protein